MRHIPGALEPVSGHVNVLWLHKVNIRSVLANFNAIWVYIVSIRLLWDGPEEVAQLLFILLPKKINNGQFTYLFRSLASFLSFSMSTWIFSNSWSIFFFFN